MTVYVDLYFILNFLFDLFALLVCIRLLGYRRRVLRLLLACTLGALYAVASPGFRPSYAVLLHLLFGILMLLIACGFGSLRRFLRLTLLFFGVCFLLGGAVTALGRGIALYRTARSGTHLTLAVILACGMVGASVCLFWGRITLVRPGQRVAQIRISHGDRSLSFQAYADTANLLRDPLENTPVVLANAALSRKVYALFSDAPPPGAGTPDPSCFEGMPLRLIPCNTVGGSVILAALKFPDASVDGQPRPLCVALDLKRTGDYCGCDALLPVSVL